MPFAELAAAIDILGDAPSPNVRPSWNTAPTQDMLVVSLHPETRRGIAEKMHWGLIPRWSREPKMTYPTFNAKAETIDALASFKAPWREGKRCLVITEGFYEWKKGKRNPKIKQPYAIARAKSKLTVMAGLWEIWRDRQTGEVIKSCTIITITSNDLIAPLHDRMPVILHEDDWPKWLGKEPATVAELKALLRTYPSQDMELWPVGSRIGNVRNNDPDLLTPVEVDPDEFG
jgi:putative SOS response-associated peptidase YedK